MKRLILSTMMVLGLGLGSIFVAPTTAKADDWGVRYNAYRSHWNDHWRWRDRYYQPYYHHYYHTHPHGTYYHSYRPSYGTYYYRNSPYGYRDYRSGGAVRLGPVRVYWR